MEEKTRKLNSNANLSSMADTLDLADVLAIWPIAESLAIHTPIGDLINLSRTTSTLRSSLHGALPDTSRPRRLSVSRPKEDLDPEVGKHQTIDWAHLKSLAPFTCSSVTHTRGGNPKPCVYCSKPICDACIVRDSFKHRHENTFKNRLRYFCRDCWSDGRPTKSFRYPAVAVSRNGNVAPVCRVHTERPHVEASDFCECTLKDNGYLCLDCKEEQNSSALAPSRLLLGKDNGNHEFRCYGLDCINAIGLDSPDKDRRRVCLWCQKPLRRQWGGEDRYAWNLKTIEARARNAESRSRDIEEYNRRRLKVMKMSRHEMRGTTNPGDELPIFVRHLDTVNYRNFMNQSSIPDPDTVYKSKNGYWRYELGFLHAAQMRCRDTHFTNIGGVEVTTLAEMTRANGLAHARLNREMYPTFFGPGTPKPSGHWHFERNKMYLNELKTQILNGQPADEPDVKSLVEVLAREYGLTISSLEVQRQLNEWQKAPDVKNASIEAETNAYHEDGHELTLAMNTNNSFDGHQANNKDAESVDERNTALMEEQVPEVAVVEDDFLGDGLSPETMEEPQDDNNDDPPPYGS